MCSYSMKPTFSPTLRESKSAPFWNTMPSFSCSARAGSSARRPCRVWPLIRISPCISRHTSMLALAGKVAQLSNAVLSLGHVLVNHAASDSVHALLSSVWSLRHVYGLALHWAE